MGKNNFFTNHSVLFTEHDIKKIPYFYYDSGTESEIVEYKEGLSCKLSVIKRLLNMIGYSMTECEHKYNELLRECTYHDIKMSIDYDAFKSIIKKISIEEINTPLLEYEDYDNGYDLGEFARKCILGEKEAPDLLCGGTPCQAFSLAGRQNGLEDDRGNLTLKFVDIVNAYDTIRINKGHSRSIVFWENVEGVLTDKTNAFGCLISSIAGFSEVISMKKWSSAGIIHGPVRNIAWRVLDAKYFGLPQQRKRLYVLAGGKDFYPEYILFEKHENDFAEYPSTPLTFEKDGHRFEVFREYTDCLYSAYGTKWNGNATAYNGSLFVVQDERIKRISPIECERLMGFPDNYTALESAKRTNRYQAIGNSWAVPVVR